MHKKFVSTIVKTKAEFNKQWPGYKFMLPGSVALFLVGIFLDLKFTGLLSLVGCILAITGLFSSPVGLIVYIFWYSVLMFISNLFSKK